MKLSVSAYRAHASAHKKILDTAYQLNYGSTSASSHPHQPTVANTMAIQPTCSTALQVEQPGNVRTTTSLAGPNKNQLMGVLHHHHQHQHHQDDDDDGGGGGGGSSDDAITPLHSPRSQNTSREEDDSSNANESDCKSPSQSSGTSSRKGKYYHHRHHHHHHQQRQDCDGDDGASRQLPSEEQQLSSGGGGGGAGKNGNGKVASQSWKNLKAVMAYYHSLRKIKRTKSNQRWMKLRTTVQISSAIQKKPPLKREDSFLQRFSSRQIPSTQETVEDTGSEGGAGGSGDQHHHQQHRRRRRLRKQPRTVVNPDENFYFYWLFVLTVCVLYNLWTLIVRQSFPELQTMVTRFWFVCDTISDLMFLIDLLVQLRTGYLEQGLMVYDSKKLAYHYLRSRAFLFDLAALCPLDLLQIQFGPQPLLRCTRFLKVYRAVNYYYMVESRTVWPNLWRVVNLIHILLILAHWFGCFYFLLSEAEGFQGDWVYPYRPGDYATLTRKYLGSLYWSTLTLTTIGDLPTPETNAEKTNSVDGPRSLPRRGIKSRLLQFNTNNGYVFTIVSYLIGVFIFATIVGQVGNVITNRNANRLEFERLLDGAKTYMRHHKVPGGMKRRVLRWYDYSWSRGRIQGGGDINTALGLLPDKLKTELALHVNLSVLKKVTIFQECQPEFLRDLVLKMKAYIFTPGDSICRKGEVAREMFIIADGILEVISEHGKVLTTMKAGDFFGEIGILNLDGLNKRTADVRSVGYSELFSLSREDVLAAMKDYPEAQEILQALGRKRLMEVKASARNPPPHHKEHHHHHSHSGSGHHHHHHHVDPKNLVDKIKNEAKGIRNALKKTRTHRNNKSDDESAALELEPLHTTGKGALKRMSRVKSHDLSQDEETPVVRKEETAVAAAVISPLGAGLPLLQRLRLLKEKQENEELLRRAKSISPLPPPPAAAAAAGGSHSPHPILSPSTSIKSPPIVEEEPQQETIIGAGLPLLQRILMLKAKEDGGSSSVKGGVGIAKSKDEKMLVSSSTTAISSAPVPSSSSAAPSTTTIKPSVKISFRDRLKFVTSTPLSDVKEPSISISDSSSVVSTENEKSEQHWNKLKKAAISRDASETCSSAGPPPASSSPPPSIKTSAGKPRSFSEPHKTKPKLVITSKNKHYKSIDDLSPEYGGLPFVKKLKILNERQKLEELESVMKTRSFSLDIPAAGGSDAGDSPSDTLTRSHSEGSTIMHHRQNTNNPLSAGGAPSLLHSSNESNETPERRNLRSILKKLSEETSIVTSSTTILPAVPVNSSATTQLPAAAGAAASITTISTISSSSMMVAKKIDSSELRKLMRAPTVEGYAARHTKLSKSVTFNRDTLQSPPNSAILLGATQQQQQQPNLFTFVGGNGDLALSNNNNNTNDNCMSAPVVDDDHHPQQEADVVEKEMKEAETEKKEDEKISNDAVIEQEGADQQITTNTAINKKPPRIIKDEQQYFTDILLAIKQVMSAHLQELQEKFYQRFERLEQEIKNRDEIINELRAHICELERSSSSSNNNNHISEDSITDSFETVVSREHQHQLSCSWEDTSHEEAEEIQELPQPLHIWQAPLHLAEDEEEELQQENNVVVEIDSSRSTTDTSECSEQQEEEEDEEEEEEGDEGEEEDSYENSSANWEIEMLAAQMREKRSASLDHNTSRPLRKRFTRGGSAEARND